MVADVIEAQRAWVVDEHAEHAPAPRQFPDGPMSRLVDPGGDELGELATLVVEYSEGAVACPGQFPSRVDDPAQDDRELDVGEQVAPERQEAIELLPIGRGDRGDRRAHEPQSNSASG